MEKENLHLLMKKINILSDTLKRKDEDKSRPGGSHGMTLNQSSQNGEDLAELLDLTTEYQLTVRLEMQLTRRQISMLLEILNYQIVYFGMTFGMYLISEHLDSLLIGQKGDSKEIRDENERRVVTLNQILLSSLGNSDLNMIDPLLLPEKIIQTIIENRLVMDRRVYGSRLQKWRPEKFITILSVPLNIQFERVKGRSEKYSSYCKGYGESHPSAHRQKTKPSPELDGEKEDRDFLNLRQIASLLILTQLEIRAKFQRKFRET